MTIQANVILTNGARLLRRSHAQKSGVLPHPKSPTPTTRWSGTRPARRSCAALLLQPGDFPVVHRSRCTTTRQQGCVLRRTRDSLVRRSTPFNDIVAHLIPFFVSRQVVCGAGRVGIGYGRSPARLPAHPESRLLRGGSGLGGPSLKRPIINTRDEPHADPELHRRLHVIIGDANLAELSTFLKIGTTSLVLAMIEDEAVAVDLWVDNPVTSLQQVSHDPTLRHLLTLRDGRRMTAVHLQMAYAGAFHQVLQESRWGTKYSIR